MSATDALQQETGHLCLPVKLCLGNSELLLGLGRAGESVRASSPASLPSASPVPRGPPRGRRLPSVADGMCPLDFRPGTLTPRGATALPGALCQFHDSSHRDRPSGMGFHTHSLAPLTSPCIRGKSNPVTSRGPTVEVISPQRGSDNPHSGPELETHLSPGAAAMPGLPLPTPSKPLLQAPQPHSPCPPHHSRAAETTQGRSAGEGGGTGQQGTGGGGGQLNPRACALPQLLRLQALPPIPFPIPSRNPSRS